MCTPYSRCALENNTFFINGQNSIAHIVTKSCHNTRLCGADGYKYLTNIKIEDRKRMQVYSVRSRD